MARAQIAAPPHPSKSFTPAKAAELKTLRAKGQRTLPEANKLIDLLVERVDALEAKVRISD